MLSLGVPRELPQNPYHRIDYWKIKKEIQRYKEKRFSVPLHLCVEILCKKSIVLGYQLKVTLRMVADRTNFGCCLADDDVSAVAALPDTVSVA